MCHNGGWLLDVFRSVRRGVGHASRWAIQELNQLAFGLCAVFLWIVIGGVYEFAFARRRRANLDDEPFDMTVEMSRSRRTGCILLLFGLLAIAITFVIWSVAGWV